MALRDCACYVGIDWGSAEHAVCVIDDAGRVKVWFTIAHTAAGFAQLAMRLGKLGEAEQVPIGIERPDGRLVDVLLEAGHPVVPVKSNAVRAWRDAEVLSGARSDAGGAQVIAGYLRLRRHRLTPARPCSPQTKALRTVVRTRDDIVKLRVMATNMLASPLEAFWPGAKEVFNDIESPIALAFLTDYPTPASAAHLGEKRMAAFCARHSHSGKRLAAVPPARLRSPPARSEGPSRDRRRPRRRAGPGRGPEDPRHGAQGPGPLGPDQAGRTSRRDRVHLAAPGRADQSRSAPGRMGRRRSAYDGPDAVAAFAGVAPLTKAHGRHHAVTYRWACNKRLRQAITGFADNNRHSSPRAADLYQRTRDRGMDHPHAVRVLARAWIRVIYHCWLDSAPYDPAKHRGAAALTRPQAA